MTTRCRVAVIQAGSVPFDGPGSIEKAADLMAQAARERAKLVVFPEAFVGGYPKGLDFGARVGMRSPEGRSEFQRYWEGAIEVPGPATDAIAAAAKMNDIYVVIGVIERDAGTLYCTVAFFSPDGDFLGKHRKLMPTAMERLIWGFGDGSTLPVIETPVGRIASVICWENYMPMLRMAMYAKGVQLYCASTVDDRETWIPTVRHIALEGRCFVLSASQYITRGAYPEDYPAIQGHDPQTVLIRGGSCIVSPLGEMLAGPDYDGERVLIAEVDVGEIAGGKYDLDVVGHYSRPDVFRLYVNERANLAAVYTSAPPADPFAEPGGG
ncbi:MAG: carbon-nitrogen hydrolase family protein [Actinomycetota bacterium]